MQHGTESEIVFTARVRSTREGNIYTWECLSVHNCGGGVPRPRSGGGVPHSRSSQGGGPHPRSGQGGYPLPPDLRYPPDLGWGTPPDLGWGTPSPQTWDWVPPPPEHLIRGGRYASCVHAGRLSCYYICSVT